MRTSWSAAICAPRSEAPASERTSPKLRFDSSANEAGASRSGVPKLELGNKRKSASLQSKGFSLLEVILAIAILTGAVAVLGELARMGMDNARFARCTARAQILAESKMNQIAAGIAGAQSTGATQFSSDEVAADSNEPLWMYAVDVQQTEESGVVAVRVTVSQDPPGRPPIEVSITCWMADKTVEESMASEAEALLQANSGS